MTYFVIRNIEFSNLINIKEEHKKRHRKSVELYRRKNLVIVVK